MKALNQTPSKIVNDRECESEDSVEITFQILTISHVILRTGWVIVINLLMCITIIVSKC